MANHTHRSPLCAPPGPRRQDWSKVIEKDLNRLDLSDDLDPFFGLPQMQVRLGGGACTCAPKREISSV